MPTGTTSTPATPTLSDTPAPRKTPGLPDVQSKQISPLDELEHLFSLPEPPTTTPSVQPQSATDSDHDANPAVPQSVDVEDEYTLSAYGDISLGEVVVPPLPTPARPRSSPLQPRIPQPRLRLKVRRPPMPKRRPSYTYIPDRMPHTGGMVLDDRWPGSPRPIANSPPWLQHQPMVSPLPVDPATPSSRTQEKKPVKKCGSSLEKLFEELLPRSPSIRLSPPGSPASQVLSLPQAIREQKSGVRQERNLRESDDAAKLPQSPPAPAPRQDKPKSVAWRTRLPPRLPIPKWDM